MKNLLLTAALVMLLLPLPAFAETIGHVVAMDGISTVDRNQTTLVTEVGMELEENDWVRTGDSTKVKIILFDGSIISMGPKVKLAMQKFKVNKQEKKSETLIKLLSGSVRFWVGKIFKNRNFHVRTPTAVAGVRGTHFVIQTSLENETTSITTISGTVAVTLPASEISEPGKKDEQVVVVPAGEEIQLKDTDKDLKNITPVKYDKKRIKALLKETYIPISLESFKKFNGKWIGGASVGLTPDEYNSIGSAPFSTLDAMEHEFGADRPMGKELAPTTEGILDYQPNGGVLK